MAHPTDDHSELAELEARKAAARAAASRPAPDRGVSPAVVRHLSGLRRPAKRAAPTADPEGAAPRKLTKKQRRQARRQRKE